MDLGLLGRTVLVTGATGDIGRACAVGYAAEGANVVLFARTADPLDQLASDLRNQFKIDALAVAGDMTSPSDIERLSSGIANRFGSLDVLVVNTGRPPLNLREVIAETEDQRWVDAHEVQLRAGVRLVSHFVQPMVARGWGRIIAITTASIKQPMPHHGLSTIYRAGLAAYLKHLANEIASSGVTVNMVAPASIITKSWLANWEVEDRIKLVPMRRLGTPKELASAVLHLSSVDSGFITGVHLQVDGGMTASLT